MREQHIADPSRAIEMLQTLVRMNTCQPEGNEAVAVDYLESLFAPFRDAIEVKRIDHGRSRSSLVVRLGADVEGGLAIIGHLDTVAIGNRDNWAADPFSGEIIDDTIYGRGSVDMKGGVAIMTDIALTMLERGDQLKKPLYLVYTADEESGLTGVNSIVENECLRDIAAVVIAEPTSNKIAIAEKGALWFRFLVHGKLAHGSKPAEGINAVEMCMEIAKRVKEVVLSEAHRHDLLGQATASVNKLSGGIMTNVIPAFAELEIDCRTLPDQENEVIKREVEDFIQSLIEELPELCVETEILNDHPAIGASSEDSFIQAVQRVVEANGQSAELCGMTYYTDGGVLVPALDIPFVIMGPGDEALTHQVNEAMCMQSFAIGHKIFSDLVSDFCL